MSGPLILSLATALLGAFVLVAPHFLRRYSSGVRTDPGLLDPEPEQRIFRIHTFGWIMVVMGLIWALMRVHPAALVILPLFPEFVGIDPSDRTYFLIRLRPTAPPNRVREAELSSTQDRPPAWAPLLLLPFLFPVAAWAYLRAHWAEIPVRYAVHWGPNGELSRWVTRTTPHVTSLLLFAEGLLALLLFLAWAEFHGARRSRSLWATLAALLAVMYFIGLMFSWMALTPLIHVRRWVTLAFSLTFISGLLLWVYKMHTDASQPTETTPDEFWSAGGIYSNPQDPALFVEKRTGLGFTLNFGNPRAMAFLIVFVGGIVALVALLFWLQR